ncbi:hypothetical protein STAS_29613, partial [Striga asiatica]
SLAVNPRKKDVCRLTRLAQRDEDSEEEEPEIGVGKLSIAISTHISAQGIVEFGCVLRRQEQITKTWAKTDTTMGDAEITHLSGIKWGLTLAKEGGWTRCECMVKCKDLMQKLISGMGSLCALSHKLACEAVRGN